MSLFTGMNLNPERYAERYLTDQAIGEFFRYLWDDYRDPGLEIIEGEFEVIGEDALASGE